MGISIVPGIPNRVIGGYVEAVNVQHYPYQAKGDGVTDDRLSFFIANAAIATSGGFEMYVPAGTYRIGSNLTIAASVNFAPGARLVPDVGVVVTITGTIVAGRYQIFGGLGTISLRNAAADGEASATPIVFPEWWGAIPGLGNGTLDCGPAIQQAVNCGARRVLFADGIYDIKSVIVIKETPVSALDLTIEGTSRTGTYLNAAAAVMTDTPGLGINAMFVNQQNNGKLSFRRLRFQGGVGLTPNFTGYGIYAVEDGANAQAIFTGTISDCWISLGYSSLGFFVGALNNYLVYDCGIEQCAGAVFGLRSATAAVADIQFSNLAVYAIKGQLIDMTADAVLKNVVSVRGVQITNPQGDGALIKANNCDHLTVSDVVLQVTDPSVPGTNIGFLELQDCKRLNVSNCKVFRENGAATLLNIGLLLNGCDGIIHGVLIDGATIGIYIRGASDLSFIGCSSVNPVDFSVQFAGAATTGRVRFSSCRFQYAGKNLIQHQLGGQTHDLILDDCEVLDAGYNAGIAYNGMDITTTGVVRITGGRYGRTTGATANMIAALLLTNVGSPAYVDDVENVGTKPFFDPACTQIATAIRESMSADRGDAAIVLTTLDVVVQRFATVLTANRVITLPAGNFNGRRFRIVRTGLGAFTLDVGGLKVIPAGTAAFVEVEHNGAAWFLIGYGLL